MYFRHIALSLPLFSDTPLPSLLATRGHPSSYTETIFVSGVRVCWAALFGLDTPNYLGDRPCSLGWIGGKLARALSSGTRSSLQSLPAQGRAPLHARDMAPGREVCFPEWHLRLPSAHGEGSLLTRSLLSLRLGLIRTEKQWSHQGFNRPLPLGQVSSPR